MKFPAFSEPEKYKFILFQSKKTLDTSPARPVVFSGRIFELDSILRASAAIYSGDLIGARTYSILNCVSFEDLLNINKPINIHLMKGGTSFCRHRKIIVMFCGTTVVESAPISTRLIVHTRLSSNRCRFLQKY